MVLYFHPCVNGSVTNIVKWFEESNRLERRNIKTSVNPFKTAGITPDNTPRVAIIIILK